MLRPPSFVIGQFFTILVIGRCSADHRSEILKVNYLLYFCWVKLYIKRTKRLSEISSNHGSIMSLFSVHYYRTRIIQFGPPKVSYFAAICFTLFSVFPAITLSVNKNYAVLYGKAARFFKNWL